MNQTTYANPRDVTSLDECDFYHTMDLPSYGTVTGQWDLRGREAAYLGHVSLQGKDVLEIGTASGHLCFYMESKGANVVAYDLSEEYEWDMVPYAGFDYREHIADRKKHLRRLNNSFWLAHKAFNSSAKVVYGSVYDLPEDMGQFDIGIFGCILLHLRDPFLALQHTSSHIKETIIITDLTPPSTFIDEFLTSFHRKRFICFLPDASKCQPIDAWWGLPPELVVEFVKILGFPHVELSYHTQLYNVEGREVEVYTVVGHRKTDLQKRTLADNSSRVLTKRPIGHSLNGLRRKFREAIRFKATKNCWLQKWLTFTSKPISGIV